MKDFNTTGMSDTRIAIMYLAVGIDIASLVGSYAVSKKILKNLAGNNTSLLQNFGISSMSVFIAAKTAGSMPLTSFANACFKGADFVGLF